MDLHLVFRHIEGHVRHMQEVIRKVFLDHIALVAKANNEFVEAIKRIELHNVPDDWFTSDLDHWFWFMLRFFTQPCSQSSRQNDHLHSSPPLDRDHTSRVNFHRNCLLNKRTPSTRRCRFSFCSRMPRIPWRGPRITS